jgi:hypothetical protein
MASPRKIRAAIKVASQGTPKAASKSQETAEKGPWLSYPVRGSSLLLEL